MKAYPLRVASLARRLARCACLLLPAALAAPVVAAEVSEHDYFGDLPVVLSVSRLAQPLNEVPGAVTVIDRELIRRSGARDLTDLLRLVPGFVVGHINGGNPIANYHGDFDALNRRLQVFVDGRSIYSGLLAGNVSHPMMGLVLDDIERIEVLRGSNSAAYGANAFSGVVNVLTRTATDVPRFSVSLALGEKGIADRSARAAWGDERLAVRLTAARSGDNGFDDVIDDKRVDQFHLRADLRPSPVDEIMLSAGSVRHQWGATDMPRSENWRNVFVQGQWRHSVNADNDVRFNGSFDEEKFIDQIFYFNIGGPRPFRADGTGRRLSLEAEHTVRMLSSLRLVWGGQWRHEEVRSPDLLREQATQTVELGRLFGNVEWRPGENWIVNAGAMWEKHSVVGPRTAPRLSLNYHALPGHTLRFGSTQAYRMPTIYELRGNWQTPALLPASLVKATGRVKPERMVADEIGYIGEFRPLRLTVDLRGFVESGSSVARYFGNPNDVVNKDRYRKRGWETQLRWRPRPETHVLLNHTVLKVRSWANEPTRSSDELIAPTHSSSLMWFESLPAGYEIGLSYHTHGAMTWGAVRDTLATEPRLDLRLARRFRIGSTSAEASIVTHSATGSYQDGDPRRYFPRRTFATLRLDF